MWILFLMVLGGCTNPAKKLGCDALPADLPGDIDAFELIAVDTERSEVWQGHLLAPQFGRSTWAVALDQCAVPVLGVHWVVMSLAGRA